MQQRFPAQIVFRPSVAVRKAAGSGLGQLARLALAAILENGQTLEIAHQQIVFGKTHFALSSRLGNRGQLILELDLGHPSLACRVILEDDLRQAERASGVIRGPTRGRRRP
ncbi:MAG: hypothetical protein AB7F22_15435 [Reyranella sp.]|uniref:hypothetical protein n=1 Tax=Reyranella sp. TaxID=1929291 RepID=UPI003D0B76AF